MQQLDLQKQDRAAPLEEHNPPVIIPNHLQLHTPDCLNLSFGSFGSGTGGAFSGSGSFATRPLKSDLEDTSTAADVSSIGHSDSRYALFIVVPLFYSVVYNFLKKKFLAEILNIMGMSISTLPQMEI